MSTNALALPEGLSIVVVLFVMLHHSVVEQDLFKFFFTNEAFNLLSDRIFSNVLFVIVENFNDASAMFFRRDQRFQNKSLASLDQHPHCHLVPILRCKKMQVASSSHQVNQI